MVPNQVIHRQGELIRHVYFPNGGVVSISPVMASGTQVGAATVGDEGMLGMEAFLRPDAFALGDTQVQVPDTSLEMLSAEDLRRELDRRGALHDLLGRYIQVVIAQSMQRTACKALHDVPHRVARWLLTTHDRMHEQDFRLSHESLAMMLGVTRPSVSLAAAELQEAGLIRYARGQVTVLNRKRLEAASCECYASLRAHFDRLRP
jgi:CRP-like cAMP-binding protein